MAAIRRLAAVLAADLVGYSRLMGLDEEGTLGRLRTLRSQVLDPNIAENSGRLVKTTGDGFLVEFNSVIDALRCARDVHLAMAKLASPDADRRFMLRIGVHQGDIVVEDGDIFGNGVNIAARLEGIAEPGGICVSERVQEDAAGRINLDFEDIGEQQLKNIARPIRAFRVRIASPQTDETADEAIAEIADIPSAAQPSEEAPELASIEPPPLPETQRTDIAAEPAELAPAVEPALPGEAERPDGTHLFPFLAENFSAASLRPIAGRLRLEQLEAAVSKWLGRGVRVEQATGGWAPLDRSCRIRLVSGDAAGVSNRLGIDTTLGMRRWQSPATMVLRIGPLDRASFEALLPDRPAAQKLVSLIRSVAGPDVEFAINPILAGSECAPPQLQSAAGVAVRLGWNTWLSREEAAAPDAGDALFPAAALPLEEPAAAAE
jgi:class 3 adenylate cyclase